MQSLGIFGMGEEFVDAPASASWQRLGSVNAPASASWQNLSGVLAHFHYLSKAYPCHIPVTGRPICGQKCKTTPFR